MTTGNQNGVCPGRRQLLAIGAAFGAAAFAPALIVYPRAAIAAPSGQPLAERPGTAAGRFGSMSCAEALATAYADLVGLEEQKAQGMAGAFGLGMGRKQTCGAVTVMLMLAGLAGKGKSDGSQMMVAFEKEMGSIQCAYFVDQYGYGRCRDLLRFAGGQLNAKVFA